jgi:multisubunit Na+/H+ antiporter MnhB subunit
MGRLANADASAFHGWIFPKLREVLDPSSVSLVEAGKEPDSPARKRRSSMFNKLKMQITATAAGVACMVVAVVAAGFTVYAAFRLAFAPVYASGLTAAVFLALAVGLLLILKEEEKKPIEPPPTGPRRWAVLAGEIAGAFAAGAIGSPRRRRHG